MYGVTQAVFSAWLKANGKPNRSVRTITIDEAESIYFNQYWTPMNGETLAAGVDLSAYDAAVNSGVGRSKQWLLASLGGTPKDTVKKMCAKRLSFLQSLRIWKTFGKGWARRVADIEAKGIAWAVAATERSTTAVKMALVEEANTATSKTKRHDIGMTTSIAGSGTSGLAQAAGAAGNDVTASWILIGFIGVLLVTAVVFAARAHIHDERRKALLAEADKL